MNIILELPESSANTTIWVVVDCFSKKAQSFALPTINSRENLARLFLNKIWRLHGPPDDIVLDRDNRFI